MVKYKVIENYIATEAGRKAIAESMCSVMSMDVVKKNRPIKYGINRNYDTNEKIEKNDVIVPPAPSKPIIRKMLLE